MIIYPKHFTQMVCIVPMVILYHQIKLLMIDIVTHCLIIDARYVARSLIFSPILSGAGAAIHA
jgi:hypothetical protein